MRKIALFVRDVFLNIFSRAPIVLITEAAQWSIFDDCKNIQANLKDKVRVRISTTPLFIRNKVVHFASVNTFVAEKGIRSVSKTNKIILTWFHVAEGDKRTAYIPMLNEKAQYVHTSCFETKKELIAFGLKEEKIIVIPIGIDTGTFCPSVTARNDLRAKLNIKDKIVIGSFQKDGQGWSSGDEPKLIKGPDIFCDVVEILAKKYPLHILLTGPSRGYVEKRLTTAGIPYSHHYFAHASDIVSFYQALDMYIISSRKEGGPKAVLEASACGVPVVSTEVGMVPDIMENGVDCLIAPVGNIDMLAANADMLITNSDLRARIAKNAIQKAQQYDIHKTVSQYYDLIYRQLL